MSKTYYGFDPKTFESNGKTTTADISPYFFVDVEPDAPQEGKTQVFDFATRTWEYVDQSALYNPRRVGTPREFMKLFTDPERLAIKAATRQNDHIGLWYDEALAGAEFNLDHSSVAVGLDVLVQTKLITAARRDVILGADFDNPPVHA